MRIGMLGGSFDPPHAGHLLIAVDAFEALALDKLYFIPASIQPLKAGQAGASPPGPRGVGGPPVGGDPRLGGGTPAADRAGISFSVDTVAAYAERYPDAERFFLIGADVMQTLDAWREPDRIMRLAQIVLVRRGDEPPAAELRGQKVRQLTTRRIDVS